MPTGGSRSGPSGVPLKKLDNRRDTSTRFQPEVAAGSTMGSSLTCVGGLWAILSFLSMGLSCVGFYMPFWLKGSLMNTTEAYIGAFRRCNYPKVSEEGQVVIVYECGRYAEFDDIPNLWWKVTTISVGIGCGLTVLVAFTALLACCLEDVLTRPSAKVGGVLQFLAGMCIGAGCLLYPLGWDTAEVHQVCGPEAQLYNLGACTISWAYYSTMAGGGASLLCALLSCSAAKNKLYSYRI